MKLETRMDHRWTSTYHKEFRIVIRLLQFPVISQQTATQFKMLASNLTSRIFSSSSRVNLDLHLPDSNNQLLNQPPFTSNQILILMSHLLPSSSVLHHLLRLVLQIRLIRASKLHIRAIRATNKTLNQLDLINKTTKVIILRINIFEEIKFRII